MEEIEIDVLARLSLCEREEMVGYFRSFRECEVLVDFEVARGNQGISPTPTNRFPPINRRPPPISLRSLGSCGVGAGYVVYVQSTCTAVQL